MAQIHLYLTFNGQCEEAFRFYARAFKKEAAFMGTFGDMPAAENAPELSDEDRNRILHVTLPISEHIVLMGSDTLTSQPQVNNGTNVSASINAESKAEADQLFADLSEGGTVTMPLQITFWGAYFGMFTDRFGIQWMVNYDEQPA